MTSIAKINFKKSQEPINISKKNKITKNNISLKTTATITGSLCIAAGAFLAYKNHNNNYINQLAKDLSKELNQTITSKHLKSVMTKTEMLKELPKLAEQNYIASSKNIKNGTFIADLHSHTKYSDGTITVADFLEQAAEYGDKLNKINGKKFIVAMTDHDGIEGTKEALKLIVQNPDKYKNIKFIPGAEVSFVMPCSKGSEKFKKTNSLVEMPELLIYGINPFSKKTTSFFENIYNTRKAQLNFSLSKANNIYPNINFNPEEYYKFFNQKKSFCFLNQHWKIWNYLHTKKRIADLAKEYNKDPQILYEKIFNILKKSKKNMVPHDLDQYINTNNIKTNSKMIDSKLKEEICEKIFPKNINNTIHSNYELTFKDIVKYTEEENGIIGFAHPGFTMQNLAKDEMLNAMKNFIKDSNKRLKFIEKYHQAYLFGDSISRSEVIEYNKIIDQLELIQIGGRDNHTKNLIP